MRNKNFLKKKKIGIDIDEVLVDLLNPFCNYHNENHGSSLVKEDFKTSNLWETFGGTREEAIEKVRNFFESNHFEDLIPIFGAKEAIHLLSLKYELEIVTSRPKYVKNKTLNWLEEYFPELFFNFHFTDHFSPGEIYTSKSKICFDQNIEILIEDNLEYALDCVSKGIFVLLFDCPWNQSEKLPENIWRVKSWEEIVEVLN